MSRRAWLPGAGALLATFALFFLWPKKQVSARELVEQRCLQLLHAAESRNVPAMMEIISDRFQGEGGMDRVQLQAMLSHQLAQQSWVRIFMTGLTVDVAPGQEAHEARVHARFVFGRSQAQTLHDLARDSVLDAYAVEAYFVEEGGLWRLSSETHRGLSPDEVLQAQ